MTTSQESLTSPGPRAAYFDVDGTLTRTTIVGPLVFLRWRLMPVGLRELWMASLPPRGIYWLLLDKLSRAASNRSIYGCYAGLDVNRTKALAAACHEHYWTPKFFPDGKERLKQLASEGVRLVLVTGSLEFLLKPLAEEVGAELCAPNLEEIDGRFTGRLADPPMTGQEKVKMVEAHAERNGIDLKASFAFGDAIGDLPMLECVGHPVAVNPGKRLKAVAVDRDWTIEYWNV